MGRGKRKKESLGGNEGVLYERATRSSTQGRSENHNYTVGQKRGEGGDSFPVVESCGSFIQSG